MLIDAMFSLKNLFEMKKTILILSFFIVFIACKKDPNNDISGLRESAGRINTLSIITENNLWNGALGDSIRAKFASPVDGLPQQEPLFTLKQYTPELFNGFISTTRIALIIGKTNTNVFEIKINELAQPQTTVHIGGTSIEETIKILEKNYPKVIEAFKKQELEENQRRIQKSLLNVDKIKKKFGVKINIPDAYKYALEKDKFMWIRKETHSGNASLLIYEVPIALLKNENDVIQNIVQMRDTIGKNIEGTLPNTHMITEAAYAPYLFEIQLKGKPAFETKGTWELKNDFMGGPFINYAILDEANNRYLVLEGFCYNPSTSKRDLMFELEAIIKSVQFLKK